LQTSLHGRRCTCGATWLQHPFTNAEYARAHSPVRTRACAGVMMMSFIALSETKPSGRGCARVRGSARECAGASWRRHWRLRVVVGGRASVDEALSSLRLSLGHVPELRLHSFNTYQQKTQTDKQRMKHPHCRQMPCHGHQPLAGWELSSFKAHSASFLSLLIDDRWILFTERRFEDPFFLSYLLT